MNSIVMNQVREGFYLDSVALMRFARQLEAAEGIEMAAMMIGTPANKDILRDAGLLTGIGHGATPNDVIIGLRAQSESAAAAALAEADSLLRQPRTGNGAAPWRPRMLRSAIESMPDANLALISVPGAYAAAEARRAIQAGLHVLIFSDNVSLAEEAALKAEARERGLLMMGPDCGTALINGVPLAFANAIPRGSIGIVSASGTGLQEVSTLIAALGEGISHGIGTGSRDLHEEVGAITTLMAIDALDADPGTSHIVLLSKPPSQRIVTTVLERVARSAKPFTVCFLGSEHVELPPNAVRAATLQDAAEAATGRELPAGTPAHAGVSAREGWVRGLFAGGTLCAEAQVIFHGAGQTVHSNVPIPGMHPYADLDADAHVLLDLGEDRYTVGRPHPMIDPQLRNGLLRETLADSRVAVVLMDVVLGFGAHDDPAGEIATIVAEAGSARPAVVASVCGTEGDPQGMADQVDKLRQAGVVVTASNALAARMALNLIEHRQ